MTQMIIIKNMFSMNLLLQIAIKVLLGRKHHVLLVNIYICIFLPQLDLNNFTGSINILNCFMKIKRQNLQSIKGEMANDKKRIATLVFTSASKTHVWNLKGNLWKLCIC